MPKPRTILKFEARRLAADIWKLLATEALEDVPKAICKLTRADVCVIWKPSRYLIKHPVESGDGQVGRLYPYSSSLPAKAAIQHAGLPLESEKDTTGRFYREKTEGFHDNEFQAKDTESKSREFTRAMGLEKICLARFRMEEEKADFVVSVYRKKGEKDFTESDENRLVWLARFLPNLYHGIISAKLQKLVVEANNILRPRCTSLEDAKEPLRKLCALIADFFRVKEVSVFMAADHLAEQINYNLFASTQMQKHFRTLTYNANHESVTGYALSVRRTIWFHDLQNFEIPERRRLIQKEYPGIKWSDGAELRPRAKAMFRLPKDALPPPLPFLAVPIVEADIPSVWEARHGRVFGVLRASLGMNPFHFLQEQTETVEIIAQEIGRWWESIIHYLETTRRGEVWEAMVKTVSEQHERLKSDSGADDMKALADTVVQSIANQKGFAMACFRRGGKVSELKLVAMGLNESEQARSGGSLRPRRGAIVPLEATASAPAEAGGFHIQPIPRTQAELTANSKEYWLFYGMRQVLSYAVFNQSQLYGVLDVGLRDDADYRLAESRIKQYLELVAGQLALFETLAESVEAAETAQRNQLRTYAAATHQLKTPLYNASEDLSALVKDMRNDWRIGRLIKIEGMLRKARTVTNQIETLGKIVEGKLPPTRLRVAKDGEARKLCVEVANNARDLTDPRMRLSFHLDPPAWDRFSFGWNPEYAEQALDALLSNAFKYSNPNTRVRVIRDVEVDRYVIKVINSGSYHIAPNETEDCKKEEWRGEKASEREGKGLGLWITNALMESQGGELKVFPTYRDETRIELHFPLNVSKSNSRA